MKKLLTLSMFILAVSVTGALADEHQGGKAKMFEKHDTNGDGVISKSEFLAQVEERFAKMDQDGNGEISKDEAKAGKKKMRENVKERIQERRGDSSSQE